MTTPFWCLLIVSILPYVLAGLGGYFKMQQFGTLDNNHPRIQSARAEGIAARAVGAQANAWEALTVFAPAVIVAHLCHADAGTSATAATVFVVARVLHPVMYLANIAPARTLVFVVGLGCCFWLFRLAAVAV